MNDKLALHGGKRSIPQSILDRIPLWPPVFPNVPRLFNQVYRSRQWSFGGKNELAFAQAFAEYHTAEHGVFMVNGTVTLECALQALGVGPGDEVIIPALTWMATAMAVVYRGAVPVFVDIEPDTMCIDPAKVKKAVTKKNKAIIPVHLYGSMADMDAIMDLANQKGLAVIEDCAHAHGGVWAGKGVGSIGHIGSFSFQQSKTLTSGEGGACITNDEGLASKLHRLKHIGYDRQSAQGKASSGPPEGLICRNYRGTEFHALILLESLKHLRKQTEKRDANAKRLARLIRDIPGIKLQARGRRADLQGYYGLFFRFDPASFGGVELGRLIEVFSAEGLSLGKTYDPVYRHTLWNVPASMYRKADPCRTCEFICYQSALGLSHTWLLADEKTIDAVSETLHKVWRHRSELK